MLDLKKLKSIPIASVATDFGYRLSARGNGRCLLPGHADRNPSFAVKLQTNNFRCYGCGRAGSVIDLTMLMQQTDFRDACAWLQRRYLSGCEARLPATVRKAAERSPQKTEMRGVVEVAPDPELFTWIVDNAPLRYSGQKYLENRGFSGATINHFRIAQIGDSRKLLKSAVAKFGLERLINCGIATTYGVAHQLVFPSDYLLFPFLSRGAVTYLQARSIDATRKLRWVCLSMLPPSVFNADVLLEKGKALAICEGVTDTVSAFEIGMSAIGLLGANACLDDGTIALLKGRDISIVGDADSAGRQFSRRLAGALSAQGITVVARSLPNGCNDLNDYLRWKRSSRT